MKNPVAALAAAFILLAPLAASAQDAPSYAVQDGGGPADDAQIRGRIVNFDGDYDLQVRDDQGYVDNVELHQGTIINPTGLELAPGMVVSILGFNQGPTFAANEIDTPYTYDAGVPYYGGHPWSYYGPSISLGFFFGSTGWWHGDAFGGYRGARGGYHYNGGARVYDHTTVRNVYHGGSFQGRTYVAPREHGGYVRGGNGSGNRAEQSHAGGGDHAGDHH